MWTVHVPKKVQKAVRELPPLAQRALWHLVKDLQMNGPVAGNWPNYGKLSGNRHHCHIKKGKPTYVAVWWELREERTLEVTYVGTHEKAPY
jgi:mRNA-degrading endonuclease RelE of RelBE toxin-antitoxin system